MVFLSMRRAFELRSGQDSCFGSKDERLLCEAHKGVGVYERLLCLIRVVYNSVPYNRLSERGCRGASVDQTTSRKRIYSGGISMTRLAHGVDNQ